MTLPYILAAASGRCHEAPAPGGLFQDDFTQGALEDLAGRTAQGPNGGWVWGHHGTMPGAFEISFSTEQGLAGLDGETDNNAFYVDAGSATQFAELTYSSTYNTLGRGRGLALRASANQWLLCELRFNNQCRVYRVKDRLPGPIETIVPAPSVSDGDTVRASVSGDIVSFWVNGVVAGTADVSGWFGDDPGLETNTQVGVTCGFYTTSGIRALSFRAGTGDGS